MNPRPTVLTFVDYYLPGFRAGGPMRSLSHLATELREHYRFRIVTRDHDVGVSTPYPDVMPDIWYPVGDAEVMYLSDAELSLAGLRRRLAGAEYDILYFNSLFSLSFTIKPLLLLRSGCLRRAPVLLAPRGELSPGHLRTHPLKYYGSLYLGRWLGLYRGQHWHITSEVDRRGLARWFPSAPGHVAGNASPSPNEFPAPDQHPPKQAGVLNLFFLARVSPVKNLDGALQALRDLRGELHFDIYGPIGDADHWRRCQDLIAALPGNVRVRYLGALPNHQVPGMLSAYELMFLPTHGENHGHSIVEALLGSCPVLISEHTPWRGLEARQAGCDAPAERYGDCLQRFVDMAESEHADWRRGARALAVEIVDDPAPRAQALTMFQKTLRGEPE